jgi:hypothetical protein
MELVATTERKLGIIFVVGMLLHRHLVFTKPCSIERNVFQNSNGLKGPENLHRFLPSHPLFASLCTIQAFQVTWRGETPSTEFAEARIVRALSQGQHRQRIRFPWSAPACACEQSSTIRARRRTQ